MCICSVINAIKIRLLQETDAADVMKEFCFLILVFYLMTLVAWQIS